MNLDTGTLKTVDAAVSDDELMLQLQGGEPSAFDRLVRRHQGPLWGFFFRNTRDAQLAEDLTQETLLRVYNQFWDYLPRGKFRGWMFRIGRNLLIDNVRRQSHDALVHAVRGASGDDETDVLARLSGEMALPDALAERRELAVLVDGLLDQLPEEQRLTFTLYLHAGLSLPEVADALETSVPTTKSRLRLAREKLRSLLEEHGVTSDELHSG